MSGLEKARLQPLGPAVDDGPVGPAVAVQFNPSSLQINSANHTTLPREATGPAVQHTGSTSSLSLDLHFDTADEGTTSEPVDVRDLTATVARFVLPRTNDPRQAPPRVRLQWGRLIFDGVMRTMNEELSLFAASGVPLRAKVTISIEGQDPRFRASRPSAPGAGINVSAGFEATIGGPGGVPAQLRAGVAVAGAGAGAARLGVALDGESPAGFAARNGLDPAAWRTLAAPGGIALSLDAGTEVAFPQATAGAPGAGAPSGSAQPSGRAALERIDGPAPPQAPREAAETGFALARAGGVDAALQTVRRQRADSASARALEDFGLAGTRAPAPTMFAARIPLHASPAGRAPAPSPSPQRADPRATSFGAGVPLRPRRPVPHDGGSERVVLGRRAPVVVPAPAPAHAGDCGCGCGGPR